MRLLLIETNQTICRQLSESLRKHRHLIDMAFTSKAGLRLATENLYQVILVKYNSLSPSLIERIRKNGIITPILVIGKFPTNHAMHEIIDCGANDILGQPYTLDDLLIRLKIVARKHHGHVEALVFGDIEFFYQRNLIMVANSKELLTKKEAELLNVLMINRKMIVSKGQIIDSVWENHHDVKDNSVEVQISSLRKKLRSLASGVSIQSKRYLGYYLTYKDVT